MLRLLSWSVIAGFVACLNKPTFATITPDFTFFDSNGCYPVLLQGHHLGENATARIGDAEIIDLQPVGEDPALPEHAQDVGFEYTGLIPASSTGQPGWADVTVTVDGEDLVLNDGFYYRTCPNGVFAEHHSIPYTPGTTPGAPTTTPYTTPYNPYYYPDYSVDPASGDIHMEGCGLDPADTTVVFTDIVTGIETSVPIFAGEGDCTPSSATADVPDDLPPGDYTVEVVRGTGRDRLKPYWCGVPPTWSYGTYYYDTGRRFGFDDDCPFDITILGGAP
jgi:hypothetical protein